MAKNRSTEVDIIRMAALIGICVVNVPFMALPDGGLLSMPEGLDLVASFFVTFFFELKFFLLFSFIFGWGMAIQARSADSRGRSFARRYFGRMLGLALMGVAHAIWVFNGDILLLYALLGCVLWLFRDYSSRALIKIALWMLPLSIVCLFILGLLLESSGDFLESSDKVSSVGPSLGGTFLEATQKRLTDWPETFVFLVLTQGSMTFAAFLAGLAAAKSDFFVPNSDSFGQLRQKLPWLLVMGLVLNFLYAATLLELFPESYEILSILGFLLIPLGAPALSALYLYLFIQLARRVQIIYILVLAGRNSLSTYILQGILAGFIFGAYGLGLYDSVGYAGLLLLSLLIALSAMVLVGIYAKIFGRGPLEPVLRWFSG